MQFQLLNVIIDLVLKLTNDMAHFLFRKVVYMLLLNQESDCLTLHAQTCLTKVREWVKNRFPYLVDSLVCCSGF